MMPALAALRKVTAGARNDHVQNDEAAHRLGMRGGQRKCRGTTPVMPNQEKRSMAEPLGHKQPNVVGDRPLVITAQRTRTVAKTTHIRGDHAVSLGEGGYHVPPFPPGLWPTVQEHDGRSLAGCDVVHQDLAQIGIM